jgi:hypothetical protein
MYGCQILHHNIGAVVEVVIPEKDGEPHDAVGKYVVVGDTMVNAVSVVPSMVTPVVFEKYTEISKVWYPPFDVDPLHL